MAPMVLQVMVSDLEDILATDAIGVDGNLSFAVFTAASRKRYRQRLGDCIDDAKRWGWI